MRRPTARDVKDASRVAFLLASITAAAAFTYAYAAVTPLTPNKGSLKTIVLRDLSWVAVTAVVLLIPRLGDTGPKCLERLAGTVLGGAAGLAAALSHSAPVATLIAALTGAGGELLGSAGGFSYAGKMVGVSYCIVAMPAFGAFGQPRDWAVDGAMVKLAVERLAAVFIGVGLVYLLSIAWLPRAASDEAFALAEEGVARLVDLSAAAMRPAAVLAHDEEEGEGGGFGGDAAALKAAPGKATKEAFLARIATRSLAHLAVDAGVRAAHIRECEAALQAAAATRGRLVGALAVARREVVVGRLPVPRLGGRCRGGGGGGSAAAPRPVPGADGEEGAIDAAAAASTALPTPHAGLRARPPAPPPLAWRPVYFPTLGAASASWLRRAGPASLASRALPSAQLEDVGAACGSVARALWVVGDAAGGGFPAYLSTCVKQRYGAALQAAALHAEERAEAAGVVEELAALVRGALSEAAAGLPAARATWRSGCTPPAAPPDEGDDSALRSRWAALRCLQDAQQGMGQQRSAFEAAEEATLAGVERWHAKKASHSGGGAAAGAAPPTPPSPPTPGLPPLPPPRLPNTLEASAVRIRWLALLFGFSECRRGLEELAAAVEALNAACAAACGGSLAGPRGAEA